MRRAPKPLAESDEIFLRADVALAPAQWQELQLSPRTGWVRGVVAPRRPSKAPPDTTVVVGRRRGAGNAGSEQVTGQIP